MKSLELSKRQNLAGAPAVTGPVSECMSLREEAGALVAVLPPLKVAELGAPPVAVDRRGDVTCLFTQDDDGSLRLACRLPDAGEAEYPGTLVAELDERVAQGEGAGDFMVFRGESGRLYFARRSGEGYSWLGALPGAPEFEAAADSEMSFEGDVPETAFKTVQTDLRGGLDAENARRVGEALLAGLEDAVASAHRAGCRVMPVTVRVAWRLWDGRLLHVSAPRRVGGSRPLPGKERVFLPLLSSAKGFTGTDKGAVTVSGYRLLVTPGEPLPQAWREVVRDVEIWVGAEPECLRAGELPSAVQSLTAESGAQLACSYPTRSAADVEADVLSLPMSMQASGGAWDSPLLVGVDLSVPSDPSMSGEREPEESASHWSEKCDSLLCHGGFLHVASGSAVQTSVRGNPLVPGGSTADVGDAVMHMWPQLTGGGAYTRQYIYLATGRGLVALTHDATGRHTNCRTVWPSGVTDSRHGIPTGTGLFVRTTAGEVLRVRDSRCEVMLRRVDSLESMAWSGAGGRLMLMGPGRSLVLQADAEWRAFTESRVCVPLDGCRWRRLGRYEQRLGSVQVYDLDREAGDATSATCFFSTLLPPPPGPGSLRRLWIGIEGAPVNAQAVLTAGRGDSRTELLRAGIHGRSDDGVTLEVRVPRGAPPSGLEYTLTVTGVFGRISEAGWR